MSFFGPIYGEFGPARVLLADRSQRIPIHMLAEFAALTLIEPQPGELATWIRRLEASLGVTDEDRRELALDDARPFPGEGQVKRGHALSRLEKDPFGKETGRRLSSERVQDRHLAWYLVRCATQQERRAEEGLIQAGFAVYMPRLRRWRRTSRLKTAVERPLFGGYVFVGLHPDQSLSDVERVEHVHAVVRFARERFPRPLPFRPEGAPNPDNPTISEILGAELNGDFDKTRRDRRKDPDPGAPLMITGGRFKGFPASFVARRPDERIEVMFQMFGRSNPLVLKPEEVGGLGDEG